ncbi:DinB family protein [Ammoniphilus sp. CFH 90114]|uniref:DinB family protein n=1 Tax=Ammoniphilus sp. CFH 90114 TaxID=2493665 RepID=UPI00100E8F7E|nr:DinB family protein [Ammoniphilus sp. CFH 90114]RXT03604.1 DinB family protein [Ammoniphilus sp. CFH 90114]
MSKQFELTRGALLQFLKELDEKIIDVQPKGFNNTIRWHVGHLLFVGEKFMFGYPKRSLNIPAAYESMFGLGTKPSQWTEDITTLTELISYLEDQTRRINDLNEEYFAQSLPFKFPFGNIQTFGELFQLMMYHEAEHLGQMKAMKRWIEA